MDRETAKELRIALLFAAIAFLVWLGQCQGYRDGDWAADTHWRRQLIEKNLGRWVCDPITGERRFEVGQGEKGREYGMWNRLLAYLCATTFCAGLIYGVSVAFDNLSAPTLSGFGSVWLTVAVGLLLGPASLEQEKGRG